jgi:hypothetical protein
VSFSLGVLKKNDVYKKRIDVDVDVDVDDTAEIERWIWE